MNAAKEINMKDQDRKYSIDPKKINTESYPGSPYEWQLGKTAASIGVVSLAHTLIKMIKEGELVLTDFKLVEAMAAEIQKTKPIKIDESQ